MNGADLSEVNSAERLERDAMAWPPAKWERAASGWRDDLWSGPDSFLPYDLETPAAKRQERTGVFSGYGTLFRELLETLVLTALIFVGIRVVVQNFRIEGRSMYPTLSPDQYLLVNKLAYRAFGEPQRGDIIVFDAWSAEKDFIKRIVGIPGDVIEIHDGTVHVNGVALEEPYLDQPTTDTVAPITVGPDMYYVLGDNRGNSSDSRVYGLLEGDKIVGKAWLTYWPLDDVGLIPDSQTSFASSP